jgi:membrane-associated protease RseP (regulator of RpoE activity)
LAVTLPYFIPLPFISLFGTLGAFIQLREPIRNRKMLLDVGAAGPLTGLIFALPILLYGLATSPVLVPQGGLLEGNSLVYALAKIVTFGRFLPDGQVDVILNQWAWAGWTGLLVTALNLIPLGQFDGGHVLYSLLGRRARIFYYPLMAGMILLVFASQVWLLWVVMLFLFGRVYATPLDDITPLDSRRRGIALLVLFVFAVIFVPIPFTEVPPPDEIVPESSALLMPMLLAQLTAVGLWLRKRI